ncbi:hypothetical protein LTR95_012109 [Oleoguttula sp. CCFEE 5521]
MPAHLFMLTVLHTPSISFWNRYGRQSWLRNQRSSHSTAASIVPLTSAPSAPSSRLTATPLFRSDRAFSIHSTVPAIFDDDTTFRTATTEALSIEDVASIANILRKYWRVCASVPPPAARKRASNETALTHVCFVPATPESTGTRAPKTLAIRLRWSRVSGGVVPPSPQIRRSREVGGCASALVTGRMSGQGNALWWSKLKVNCERDAPVAEDV